MRGHYHCLRTGCYFVTNITTKLPWHIKKHEKAERRAANGFKYFTKREECGRLGTEGRGWGGETCSRWQGCGSGGPGHLSWYPPLVPARQTLCCVKNATDVTGQASSNRGNCQNTESPGIGV